MKFNKQDFIRSKAIENQSDPQGQKILWSKHAMTELLNEFLTRSDVETVLSNGDVIEDYPAQHRSLPDCLVLGILENSDPLHIVVAIDARNDRIFIVTVYRPLKERWKDDWRTRK